MRTRGLVTAPPAANEASHRPLELGILLRLARYARPHKKKALVLTCIVCLRSIQLPLLAWCIGAVITGPIAARDISGILWGAAGFAALVLFTQFTMHFRQLLGLQLGEAVIHDMRADLFQHLQQMTMGFFHRTRLGRIISRMTSDVESVRVGVQDVLFVSVVQGGQMLVAATLMLLTDPVLFGLVMAMAPGVWALNRHFRGKISQAHRDMQESFSRVTSTLAESVNGMRVTQGFGRQEINAGLFRALVQDHSRYNMGAARTSGVFLPLLELNSQFFIAALMLLGGYRAMNPEIAMPLGDLIRFFFLSNLFFDPIKNLGNQYTNAMAAMAGAERVFRLLDTKPDWTDPVDALELHDMRGRVEFQDVRFSYLKNRPVLHGINFVAEPGQSIALVGETGSGKSSVINLIAKFYLPDSGRILIDGTDITRIRSDALHRRMGIVQQQNFLFSGTVQENIRLGKPGATDAAVRLAAEKLDVLDLIESLPEGFQTVVGERGAGLSLGQRQVVCFTRAMLADPRILILDEATSSIDTITEARTQKALEKLLAGRTSFVVAHRLSTITKADCVLVLNNGEIVERGTHRELVAKGGIYADLYRNFVRATEA